ncbi:hypothetical protein G6F43_012116 [Rhizopus delemar]|nr:hypothetical protein G6F43_012116 [Rhizopus delemar]
MSKHDNLTAKTAWLLAMVGFLRPSDIQRIDIDQCSIQQDILTLVVVAPKETRRSERITKAITIHPHQNPAICPVLAYTSYIQAVQDYHTKVPHPTFPDIKLNPLLRYIKQPLLPLGAERISKYINQVMEHVGRPPNAPIPKARALGATLAAQAGVAVDNLVLHGNWSSKEMFEHFYRISTSGQDITKATLDQQQRTLPDRKCNIQ